MGPYYQRREEKESNNANIAPTATIMTKNTRLGKGGGAGGRNMMTTTMTRTAANPGIAPQQQQQLQQECQPTRKLLHFARNIKPPVLGSQQEYCHQVLAQGLQLPNCELGKAAAFVYNKSLFYAREEGEKPHSSSQLKNWRKWCKAWKEVEQRVKKDVLPPSLITSGEGFRRKKEDIELIDRTIHRQHINGFNSIPQLPHDPTGELLSLEEREPMKIYRTRPPIEKIRIPKEIRKEMGLPARGPPVEPSDLPLTSIWKWEKHWDASNYLKDTKSQLKPIMKNYEPLHPCSDKLTLMGKLISLDHRVGLGESKPKQYQLPPSQQPDIIFTKDSEDVLKFPQTDKHVESGETGEVYTEQRGTKLLVQGERITHRFYVRHHQNRKSTANEHQPQLQQHRTKTQTHPHQHDQQQRIGKEDVDESYVTDSMDGFSSTTKCKEIRYVTLKNEGTTLIRYQWLRSPPSKAMRELLANPGFAASSPSPAAAAAVIDDCICCMPGEKLKDPKKTVVHLTQTRTIDPALTRTLKIMRNCATADRAYENLLLLLSLRVPRLRRLIVRRTGRQLKSKKLPLYIQQLYWRNLRKDKIRRDLTQIEKVKQDEERKASSGSEMVLKKEPTVPAIEVTSPTSPPKEEFDFQARNEEIDKCYCPCCEQKYWSEFGGEDPTTDGICRCILPCTHFQRLVETEGEDFDPTAYEPCQPDLVPNESRLSPTSPEKNTARAKCFAEWNDESGEGDIIEFSRGSTPDFYPLYKGHPPPENTNTTIARSRGGNAQNLPKCRDLVPDPRALRTLAEPNASLEGWMTAQMRDSLLEPPPEDLLLHVDDSDQWEPVDPNHPTFRELHGYQITQDYDSQNREAEIIIGQTTSRPILPRPEESSYLFGGEGDGIVPIRSVWENYKLDTESIPELDLARSSRSGGQSPNNSFTPLTLSMDADEADDILGFNEFSELSAAATPVTSPVENSEHKVLSMKPEKVLEILKEPSYEFHFRELPGVLFPGQTLDFPIIFRPRKTGVFHETIYLLIHPRITTKTFCIRLNGICVDPDTTQLEGSNKGMIINEVREHFEKNGMGSSKKKKTVSGEVGEGPSTATTMEDVLGGSGKEKTQLVQRHLYETMLRQQGIDLLDAIMDHVLFSHQTRSSTLPYGKVTREALFQAHNPTLYYHHGVSEIGLETLQSLCNLLIPQRMITESGLCKLNIRDLYSTFWTKVEPRDDELQLQQEIAHDSNNTEEERTTKEEGTIVESIFTHNLKSDVVESLLEQFSECSKILIEPRNFASPTVADRIYMASYSTMLGLLDRIVLGFEDIQSSYDESELDRFTKMHLREKRVLAAAELKIQKKSKKTIRVEEGVQDEQQQQQQAKKDEQDQQERGNMKMNYKDTNKIDVATQKSLVTDDAATEEEPGYDAAEVEVNAENESEIDAILKSNQIMMLANQEQEKKMKMMMKVMRSDAEKDEVDEEDGDGDDDEVDLKEMASRRTISTAKQLKKKQQQQLNRKKTMGDVVGGGKHKNKKGKMKKKDNLELTTTTDEEEEEDDGDEGEESVEEIDFRLLQQRKSSQLKLLMVEKYLSDGIEKLVSVIDTFQSEYPYARTPVITKTDPLDYCC